MSGAGEKISLLQTALVYWVALGMGKFCVVHTTYYYPVLLAAAFA